MRQASDHTPVWLMRQAGRYLPEYRETRGKAGSFMGLATNTDYATEVTLQPLARYKLDAAILFSDILTIPDAMGLGLYFAEGEGPKFERPLREEWEIRDLLAPDPDAPGGPGSVSRWVVAVAALAVLTVAATAIPHAEVLEFIKPKLAAQGLKIEIKVFNDYVQPNTQVAEKRIDVSYFETLPYLETFNRDKGTHLVPIAAAFQAT